VKTKALIEAIRDQFPDIRFTRIADTLSLDRDTLYKQVRNDAVFSLRVNLSDQALVFVVGLAIERNVSVTTALNEILEFESRKAEYEKNRHQKTLDYYNLGRS
jgi:hypothetical protein